VRVLLVCALSTTIIAAQAPVRPTPGQTPPRDRPARIQPTDVPEPERHANAIIRGRVVADEPGANTPIRKVRVVVRPEAAEFAETMFTDSFGLFEFSGLPAGRYTVYAEKSAYAPTRYGAAGLLEEPIHIDLADGGREEIEVSLPRGAVIAGRVVDELGEAIVGARVLVNAIRVEGTRQRLVASPQVPNDTDDQGAFRIGGLPAGRYLLSIIARQRDQTAFTAFDVASPQPLPRVGAGRVFYPSSATAGGATPIELSTGEERLDLNVALTPYRQATLTVTISRPSDPALKGATSPAEASRLGVDPSAIRPTQQLRVAFGSQESPEGSGQQGEFGFSPFSPNPASTSRVIDPGSWAVIARKGADGAIGYVTLGAGETQSLALDLRPASRVSGRVIFEGSTSRPDLSSISLSVIGAGPDRSLSSSLLMPGRVSMKPDGTFSFGGVLGTVEFLVSAPNGWAASRFAAGDRDLLGTPLTFAGGEDISDARIILTDRVGEISGSVVESDARPAAGCNVAVFPAERDARFNRYRMRQIQTDRAGRFVIRGFPAGSYAIASTRDLRPDSWTAPESLARLRATAITLTLADHEKKALALQCGSQ
jgi:carboxypeptidase family protein